MHNFNVAKVESFFSERIKTCSFFFNICTDSAFFLLKFVTYFVQICNFLNLKN